MKNLRIALASLLVTSALHAEEPKTISTAILTVATSGITPNLYYKCGKKHYQLAASATGMSSPVSYQGPEQLDFFKSPKDLEAPANGERPPVPLGSVTLPEGDRVILLFAPDSASPEKLTIRAFPVDRSRVKAGDYEAYNFSTRRILALFGEAEEPLAKAAIAPGKSAVLSSPSLKEGTLDLPVQIGYEENGKTRVLTRKLWGHRAEKRTFLFFFDSTNPRKPIDIRRYYDVPGLENSVLDPEEAPSTQESGGSGD